MSTSIDISTKNSVFQNRSYWYIAAASTELKNKPIRVMLWNEPLVLFRDADGLPQALLDRCPHRNVPLSAGTILQNHIQCPYHGWEFDGKGTCVHIPGRIQNSASPTRTVRSFPAREQQGFCECRIQENKSKLSNAQIIDVTKVPNNGKVIFGSTVTVYNTKTDEEVTYQIVGDDEADIKSNLISVNSPIARALIGKEIDDIATVTTPNGEVEYEVVEVKYI